MSFHSKKLANILVQSKSSGLYNKFKIEKYLRKRKGFLKNRLNLSERPMHASSRYYKKRRKKYLCRKNSTNLIFTYRRE